MYKINPFNNGKFDITNSASDFTVINNLIYLRLDGTNSMSSTTLITNLNADLLDGSHATAFPLLVGRAGGQTLIGGTAVTDVLKLQGTSGNGTLTSPAIQLLVGNNGGTTALTVLNNGRVGIGTTNPTATRLEVGSGGVFGTSIASVHFVDNSLAATVNYQNTNVAGYTAFDFFNSSNVKQVTFALSNPSAGVMPSAFWFGSRVAIPVYILSNDTIRMTITATGMVGIGGTPSASTKLSLCSTYVNTSTPTADEQTSNLRLYDGGDGGINYGFGVSLNALNIAANQNTGTIRFYTNAVEHLRIDENGKVGISTTTPTNILSLGGNSARTFWMERHTTANTAGNNLTIQSGGATSGATDKAGGNLILQSAISTGTGTSQILFQTPTPTSTGTSDNSPVTRLTIDDKGVAFAGAMVVAYRAITALRTLDATDYFINCTANTFSVTLPTAANITGRVYIIKNTGTGIITVDTTSSQTIDGYLTMTLSVQNSFIAVCSNGSNWLLVGSS